MMRRCQLNPDYLAWQSDIPRSAAIVYFAGQPYATNFIEVETPHDPFPWNITSLRRKNGVWITRTNVRNLSKVTRIFWQAQFVMTLVKKNSTVQHKTVHNELKPPWLDHFNVVFLVARNSQSVTSHFNLWCQFFTRAVHSNLEVSSRNASKRLLNLRAEEVQRGNDDFPSRPPINWFANQNCGSYFESNNHCNVLLEKCLS